MENAHARSCRSCRPNAPFAELVRLSKTSIAEEMREEHKRRVLTDTGTAVGVGTTSPGAAFGVTGLGYFSGGVNVEADQGYQIGGASTSAQ